MEKKPTRVFIAASIQDAEDGFVPVFTEGITKHLHNAAGFEFSVWDMSQVIAGTKTEQDVQQALAASQLVIYCISADFLATPGRGFASVQDLFDQSAGKQVLPVYFRSCRYTAWHALKELPLFKPAGEKYGKGSTEDFCFCDLVKFRDSDGKRSATPQVDRYCQDLAMVMENMLNGIPVPVHSTAPVVAVASGKFLNLSAYPGFSREDFVGREDILNEIDQRLPASERPLLLSGIGGMGKTAVAVAYGRLPEYNKNYDHIAWVNNSGKVIDSLFYAFSDIPALAFSKNAGATTEIEVEELFIAMAKLPGNNLLLVDNVNDEKELRNFVSLWTQYNPGWKCIVTTRCYADSFKSHLIKLKVLSLPAAEALFKKMNDEAFDEESFRKIYEMIGGHTMLVELLAKYGQQDSRINSTASLLQLLQEKGVAGLRRSVEAKQAQFTSSDQQVSAFVMSLYDPLTVPEPARSYLRYFATLQGMEMAFEELVTLFGIAPDDIDTFDESLGWMVRNGWLSGQKGRFKCHQIISEIVTTKLPPDENNCKVLVDTLDQLFSPEKTLEQALPYFEAAYAISKSINFNTTAYASMQFNLAEQSRAAGKLTYVVPLYLCAEKIYEEKHPFNAALCADRLGDIYMINQHYEENLAEAMKYYETYRNKMAKLAAANPESVDEQRSLAIAWFKIGTVYQERKKASEAEIAFQHCLDACAIVEKMQNGNSLTLKNIKAGTLSKLGELMAENNAYEKAKDYYMLFHNMEEQLVQEDPSNQEFRNNLAVAYFKLGDLSIDKEEARKWFRLYYNAKEALYLKNKLRVDMQYTFALANGYLGSVTTGTEQAGYLAAGKKLLEELVEKVPENERYSSALKWINNLVPASS